MGGRRGAWVGPAGAAASHGIASAGLVRRRTEIAPQQSMASPLHCNTMYPNLCASPCMFCGPGREEVAADLWLRAVELEGEAWEPCRPDDPRANDASSASCRTSLEPWTKREGNSRWQSTSTYVRMIDGRVKMCESDDGRCEVALVMKGVRAESRLRTLRGSPSNPFTQ